MLHLIQYSDVSVSVTFDTIQWRHNVYYIFYNAVMSNYLKLVFIIEQYILDTNAGKQLSNAATDV